jgi:antirestriction protein ArdC
MRKQFIRQITNGARPDAPETPKWADLLERAVKEPGVIASCYSRFWNYSVGNMLLAWCQCLDRQIELGPLNTYRGWAGLGRQVKRGEKALTLCMPLTFKRDTGERDENDQQIVQKVARFMFKSRWFVLAQTEGDDSYQVPEVPGWDLELALANLGIGRIPFTALSGNTQGYAREGKIAISPLAENPVKTTVHEMAHVLLHLSEEMHESGGSLPRNVKEVEAEATALLVVATLGLPGVEQCRGYVQFWVDSEGIAEESARRIMGAADKILKAGRSQQVQEQAEEQD